jgi:hypothetical protein
MNNIWVDTVLVDGERVTDTALGISFGGMMVDIIPMHTRLPTSVNGHGDGVRDQSDIEIIVLREQ